jgi:hypothetical protein
MIRDAKGVEAAIVAFVCAHPGGVRRGLIAAHISRGKSATLTHLMMLLADGVISRVGTGPATVWGPPGLQWKPLKPRSAAYLRSRAAHQRARRAEATEKRLIATMDDPLPVTRMITREWRPMAKLGPASVWELA